jgi:hypothetical protein
VGVRCNGRGQDTSGSAPCLAREDGGSFNVENGRPGLGEVYDGTKRAASVFALVYIRAARLKLQCRMAGAWQPLQRSRLMMVMQRRRKDVDEEVSDQCGSGNQRTA